MMSCFASLSGFMFMVRFPLGLQGAIHALLSHDSRKSPRSIAEHAEKTTLCSFTRGSGGLVLESRGHLSWCRLPFALWFHLIGRVTLPPGPPPANPLLSVCSSTSHQTSGFPFSTHFTRQHEHGIWGDRLQRSPFFPTPAGKSPAHPRSYLSS